MNAQTLAQRAYAQNARSTQTPRGTEYELIAKVTHRIKAAAEAGPRAYPRLVEALYDNQRLWTALAVDVADSENGLPAELRARIFYLAEFVQHHTSQVLSKKARIRPLLEINAAILKGLSGRSTQK
ncbi:flagellar biosynthesis regulator FlaF [Mameliella sediminis]|uniref:flagellar biosynthesis regulator FlaF n=1 Tax=Mameliella sediminis TaxID=2836866 RepID=UPI001C43B6F0|nr:flagellar biosynthesis regulator FlaF [Mameliella sediminis]MBY6114056.1 flagellar biosynthesis regulator FlaF [Antarctobacter heliothermus]MBY6142596.1 flagellar biosynthesis regulator FlaF [Mameliella alba]MBY6159451.1 flagellar biosynthesis regulator FlaF [Mameliella alba]MBY6167922.1 flagellar biosynthesis regulator FlaF [Mameliella alba]